MYIGLLIVALLFVGILSGTTSRRGKKGKSKKKASNTQTSRSKTSLRRREDAVILKSRISELSGGEFERLLALYFTSQGNSVEETGKFGDDGGVDLVIKDKRGERTAVQAKCFTNSNVPPKYVRELVGAKRNHNCVLSLLVTTTDLSEKAKGEARTFNVDFWNGLMLQNKLKAWKAWQGKWDV